MNIIVDGLQVSLDRQGEGSVLLFLHGWQSDKSSFTILASQLKHSYQTLAIDLPGFGASQVPDEPWGIEEYSSFLGKLIKKLKITDFQAIIGHSMGAQIAIAAAATGEVNPKKMVLLSAAGVRKTDTLRKQSFKVIAKTGKVAAKVLPKSVQGSLKQKLYDKAGTSDYIKAGHMKETFKKIVSTDVQEMATNVEQRCLLIYGREDDQTPVEFGELLAAAFPHGHLEVFEHAGHFVHIDKPEATFNLMKEFL